MIENNKSKEVEVNVKKRVLIRRYYIRGRV